MGSWSNDSCSVRIIHRINCCVRIMVRIISCGRRIGSNHKIPGWNHDRWGLISRRNRVRSNNGQNLTRKLCQIQHTRFQKEIESWSVIFWNHGLLTAYFAVSLIFRCIVVAMLVQPGWKLQLWIVTIQIALKVQRFQRLSVESCWPGVWAGRIESSSNHLYSFESSKVRIMHRIMEIDLILGSNHRW